MQRNPQQTNQNRANNLLINFIQNRYPNLINKNNINFIINGLENDTNQRYQRWIGTLAYILDWTRLDWIGLGISLI